MSQNHAAKLTQILNEMADKLFPGKYNSDFAVQVTSVISDAQQFTINFTNNNLLGSANFLPAYKTSKARVCVPVGMMTTGYDCPDILNLCLIRPIFSPTDFIQIKGRGTRKHNFLENLFDVTLKEQIVQADKSSYKLFDFFANCEYFEEKYNYDEVLKLPARSSQPGDDGGDGERGPVVYLGTYENVDPDKLTVLKETAVGYEGMKVDRMFYQRFEETVTADQFIKDNVLEGRWDRVVEYVRDNVLDKPEEFFTEEKLRKAAGVDRRLPLRELVEKAFGLIAEFKSKDELLEEEFAKFVADAKPETAESLMALKYYFKAYATDQRVREIVENRRFTDLNTNPSFTMQDFKAVPQEWRTRIPEYIKDYISLNQFMV